MTNRHAVLQRLRAATAGRHEAIERTVAYDENAGLARVVAMLQVFEAFLRRWEPQVRTALGPALHDWFDSRRRAAWAAQDLAALRAAPLRLGREPQLILPTRAAALGSMYVVEGSALGGQVIARSLAQRHGIGMHNGAAFFATRGSATGPMWREFCDVLERELAGDDACVQCACEAANATFAALTALFEAQDRRAGGAHGSASLAAP